MGVVYSLSSGSPARLVSSERMAASAEAEPTTTQSISLSSAVVLMAAAAVCARVFSARIPAAVWPEMLSPGLFGLGAHPYPAPLKAAPSRRGGGGAA